MKPMRSRILGSTAPLAFSALILAGGGCVTHRAVAPHAESPPVPAPPVEPPKPSPAPIAAVSAVPAARTTKATRLPQQTPVPVALDLPTLEQRLRDTHAIGVFTKLSLKNEVDDLLARFRSFHRGQRPPTLAELRQSYELLLIKVVTLLQSGDAELATAISTSREAIWNVLSDPKKFAQI